MVAPGYLNFSSRRRHRRILQHLVHENIPARPHARPQDPRRPRWRFVGAGESDRPRTARPPL